jgi:hypothetical protein
MKITVSERDAVQSDRLLEQYPEYGGITFLRNIDKIWYTTRRHNPQSSNLYKHKR